MVEYWIGKECLCKVLCFLFFFITVAKCGGSMNELEKFKYLVKTPIKTYLDNGDEASTVRATSNFTGKIGYYPSQLRCTYTIRNGDIINDYGINWQMETTRGTFENIASFSTSNNTAPTFTILSAGLEFRNRSTLINPSANSPTAILQVNVIKCTDERRYRCYVLFTNPHKGSSEKYASISWIVQAPAQEPYEVLPETQTIEEHLEVQFTCTANVGKPPGKIKWRRYREGIQAPDLLQTSTESPKVKVIPGVCEYNVTSTLTINMTKDDDQSVLRCTAENIATSSIRDINKPHKETDKINVFYAVRTPAITKYPNLDQFNVGSQVTLTCSSIGNPNPSDSKSDKDLNKYVWMFKSSEEELAIEIHSSNGIAVLKNLQVNNSGDYFCLAFNSFNSKSNQASSEIVKIRIDNSTTYEETTLSISFNLSNETTTDINKTTDDYIWNPSLNFPNQTTTNTLVLAQIVPISAACISLLVVSACLITLLIRKRMKKKGAAKRFQTSDTEHPPSVIEMNNRQSDGYLQSRWSATSNFYAEIESQVCMTEHSSDKRGCDNIYEIILPRRISKEHTYNQTDLNEVHKKTDNDKTKKSGDEKLVKCVKKYVVENVYDNIQERVEIKK